MPENAPQRQSLARLLGLSITTFAVLLVLTTAGAVIRVGYLSGTRDLRNFTQAKADSAANEIRSYLDDLTRKLDYLARVRGLVNLPRDTQQDLLLALIRHNKAYELVAVADSHGQVQCSASAFDLKAPSDLSTFPEFLQAMNTKSNFIGSIQIDPELDTPILDIAVPVRDENDKVAGVLWARLNLRFLLFVLSEIQIGHTGSAYLLDNRGYILVPVGVNDYHFGPDATVPGSLPSETGGQDPGPQEYLGRTGEKVLGQSVFLSGLDWRLVLEYPVREAFASLHRMLWIMLAMAATALILGAALSRGLSRKLVHPLRSITRTAESVAAGDLEAKVGYQSNNELGVLARTFNAMTASLRSEIAEHKITQNALRIEAELTSSFAVLSQALLTRTSLEDISNMVMESALTITHSELGFAAYIDPVQGMLICPTMRNQGWRQCGSTGEQTMFHQDAGLWGWVLKTKQSLLTNKPAQDPRFAGLPPDHMPVHNFLATPSVIGNRLFGIIAVANAEQDYQEQTQQRLERLAVLYAMALERHQAEKTLEASEHRYRMLFNNASDMVLMYGLVEQGLPGLFRDVNQTACERLGYTRQELLSMTPQDIEADSKHDRVKDVMNELTENKHAVFEQTHVSKDGRYIPVEISAHLFELDGRSVVLSIVRDITLRKKAQQELTDINTRLEQLVEKRTTELTQKAEQLSAANTKLRELDELKSTFLTSVSHELRTPLTSVLGFANLINKDFSRNFLPLTGNEQGLQRKAERIRENLGVIEYEGLRLTRMINDLLELSRIESGRMQWNDTDTDPSTLLRRAIKAVSSIFASKAGVELIDDVPQTLPMLHVDKDRFEQVIINLLNNAAKFTDKGRVTVTARQMAHGDLLIRVEDTGQGIPATDLNKLFDKFHQVAYDDTREKKPEGTGLGLAICHEIVNHYNGRIWAESEQGKGSSFIIELPVTSGER